VRPLESYLVMACAVAVLWPALFGTRSRRGVIAAVLVGLVVVQWQVEGYRWPLLLLYVVAVGMAVGDVVAVERELPWPRRVGRFLFGPLGLLVAAAPAFLFPVPELPVPSGPLQIGTQTITLRHPELVEEYGERPGSRRRINVQIWYPAHVEEDAEPQVWSPDIDYVGPALARRHRLPGFFFNSARYTDTHSYPDAAVDEGGFPLVVYSHGWEGFRTNSIAQVENLVSQGYVVIAIDHTHIAVATVIDGEPVYIDDGALGDPEADVAVRQQAEAAIIDTMAEDIRLVLDEAEAGADGAFGELAAAMDPTSVGLWGHGMGGAAALQVCLTDERCDAVAGQDPKVEFLPDAVLANTATKPMLFMRSDPWRDNDNDAVLRGVVARSGTITYWVDVRGADSSDFLTTPVVSPIAPQLGMRGPIDANRVIVINRRFIAGFFDRFLLGTGSAALDTVDFSEVDVEVIDRR